MSELSLDSSLPLEDSILEEQSPLLEYSGRKSSFGVPGSNRSSTGSASGSTARKGAFDVVNASGASSGSSKKKKTPSPQVQQRGIAEGEKRVLRDDDDDDEEEEVEEEEESD